ncbi:MAG: ABC transporter permease subunit [Bauldia sp.]
MLGLLLRRLALVVPTLLAVAAVVFVAVRMVPGDPIQVRTAERGVTPERHAELMHDYGLDQPVWRQFLDFVGELAKGDFGTSFSSHAPVAQEFVALLPASLELSFLAMGFGLLFGIPAGIIAATRRGSMVDRSVMAAALVGYSMPVFWWGLLAVLFFSVRLGWTPVSGRIGIAYFFPPVTGFMLVDSLLSGVRGAFGSAVRHLILPVVVLGTIPLAAVARMTRSAMLEVLGEDYVRTARAKGLSPLQVVVGHALGNALIPVVTVFGLYASSLLAGAVLTEYVFAWPGIGSWLIQAIGRRDYPVLQGGILLVAVSVIGINLAVDLICRRLDPRGAAAFWAR